MRRRFASVEERTCTPNVAVLDLDTHPFSSLLIISCTEIGKLTQSSAAAASEVFHHKLATVLCYLLF